MVETAGDATKGGEWLKGLRDSPVGVYLLSVAAVAIALGARLLLGPISGDSQLFVFFIPAVVVGALWGGFWPGGAGNRSEPRGLRDLRRPRHMDEYPRVGDPGRVPYRRPRRSVARRAAAPLRRREPRTAGRPSVPRGASPVDPRHRSGRHGGDRRNRRDAVVQQGGGAAVRPFRCRSDRTKRQRC